MKKGLIFLAGCLLSLSLAHAQENNGDSIAANRLLTPYRSYFEFPAEEIYVHFNKNAYMTGEGVWFKLYLLELKDKRPFDLPQNIYAELFDPSGELVDQQVLFAPAGSASGVIQLADSLPPGLYTFRAYTNWMRNTPERTPIYTRTFQVNGSLDPALESPQAGDNYDIQFFPEGGTLLAGTLNTIAFKAVNSRGKGQALQGSLRNDRGDTLLYLTSSALGMGSFQLNPEEGVSYAVDFQLPGADGTVKTVPLPPSTTQGVALSSLWFFPDKISILLRVHPSSLPGMKGKKFHLMVHNQGKVAQFLSLNWSQRPVLKMDLEKAALLNGINHITLFDENFQSLADRMIFNRNKTQEGAIDLQASREGDSLLVSLSVTDHKGAPLEADMSMSFLPAETVRGNFETSIYANLLLSADLKGPVEQAGWYFEDESDIKRMQALDHLLLCQGRPAFNWTAIRNGEPPVAVHQFEQGFTLKGKVLNSISRNGMEKSQISIFSAENDLLTVVNVDSSGAFSLPNLLLLDSSRVMISATNNKGKSGFRELEASIDTPRFVKDVPSLPLVNTRASQAPSLIQPLEGELLDEVTVTGKAAEEDDPFAGDVYFSEISDRVVVITKDNYNRYNTVRDLLMKEFNIIGNSMGRGGGEPVLIVDGVPMQDLDWLDMMDISEVEAVAVNKSGNSMLGQRGGNGSINIKTRTTPVDWGPRENLHSMNLLINGFARPRVYSSPAYETANQEAFRKRAAIYWHPAVQADSVSGKATFKVPVPKGMNRFQVRTQGISSNGILINDRRLISVE